MRSLVVYESMFGNTHLVAVGGPTHAHGMSRAETWPACTRTHL